MFEKLIRDNLILIAEAYAEAVGKSLTTVAKEFYGRGDFFENLRRGEGTISIARLETMLNRFRDEWPAGAEWPVTSPIFMTRTIGQ